MSDLLIKTISLAKESTAPVAEICRATKVSVRWYYRLMAGDFKDPGVRRVQRLHDYLTKFQRNAKQDAA